MSGFIGVLNLDGSPIDAGILAGIHQILARRGSEQDEIFARGEIALAHWSRRDVAPPERQPIHNELASIHLLLAGGIFNTRALAAELRGRGHHLRSDSAAEVVVHLYEDEASNCVRHLNGQFTFLLWDVRLKRLLGARDQLGLKPFFYYQDGELLICASEIRAILEIPGVRRGCDYQGLADHLFAGAPLSDRTLFSGIRRLPPGYTIGVQGRRIQTHAYWDVDYSYQFGRSDQAIAGELAELLTDAVRIRTAGEASIGSHLSGGLDSSVVTSLASRQVHRLRTFSIRFDGEARYDETYYARLVAEQIGAEYHEDAPTAHALAAYWPALIWPLEMPLTDASGFSYFTASRLAARYVDNVLTGHGGDEVFGGYRAQFEVGFGAAPWFAVNPPAPQRSAPVAVRLLQVLRRDGARGIVDRLVRRAKRRGIEGPEDRWIRLHCGQLPGENPLLDQRFVRALGGYSPHEDYLRPFVLAPTDHLFDRCLYHDLRSYLPGLLLQCERVSNAVSIESRAPILDHRVVEYMATVPPAQKVRGLVPKRLLRMAAAWLPQEVLGRRDKSGFPVPTYDWLSRELAPWARSIILSPRTLDRGILDPDELRRGGLGPTELWQALNIELWFRIFLDQDPELCGQAVRITSAATDAFASHAD
jgi:asparagine synthase (glutamine-hydrolysing)